MQHSELIRPSQDGLLHCLTLGHCTASILRHVLNPEVPFIWLHRHVPQTRNGWWRASVPLSSSGGSHEFEVRDLEFDAQMTTEKFLTLLPEIEDHGVDLLQMSKRIPNTLRFSVYDDAMNRILVQDGLFLKLILPHGNEVAALSSPDKSHLEKLLTLPSVRDLAY